jgi:hypothetical protein
MVVHDIEMHDIGAGIQYISHFLSQSGKICRQDGRRDLVIGHNQVLVRNSVSYVKNKTRTLP